MNYLLEGQESARLKYRKLEKNDFDVWLPFHQNQEGNQFWVGLPEDPSKACEHWFKKAFHRYEKNLGGMNALIEKNTHQFIGQCGLLVQTVDGVEELEIGYSILPKYWRNGYATEAAQKCKEFARENNFAKSLISIIHVDNIGSRKVALNNGMHLDKTTVYDANKVDIYRIAL